MDKISSASTPVKTAVTQAFGLFEHVDATAVVDARRAATPSAAAIKTSRRAARANRQDLTQVAIDHLAKLASMPHGADLVPLVWSVAATAVINANTAAYHPLQQAVPVPVPIVEAVSKVILAAAPVHVEPVQSSDEHDDAAEQLVHNFVCIPAKRPTVGESVGVTRAMVGEQALDSVALALPTPSPSLSPALRESNDNVLALLDAAVADAERYQEASASVSTCLKHPGTMLSLAPPAIEDSVVPAPDSSPGDTSTVAAVAETGSLSPDTGSTSSSRRSMPSRKANYVIKSAAAVPVAPILDAQRDQNQGTSSAAAPSKDDTKDLLMIATNSRKTVTTCPLLPDTLPYPKGMRKPDDPVMPPRNSARHKRARNGDISDQDDDGEEAPLTHEEMVLKKRWWRNTMSARVSRARKQAKLDVLEAKGTRLAAELEQAQERIDSLSKMVSRKEQVIAHLVCSQEATEVAKKAVLEMAAPNMVAASIAVTLLTRIQALEHFAGHLLLERHANGSAK